MAAINAKQIKEILIEYLKVTYKEIRIYQEKSIGSSICDVMAVTDRLLGFEIKSDLDNYTRLEEQVNAYDLFFDENYLVVSSSHIKSAPQKVPQHWGILCIEEDNITLYRKAQKNNGVWRQKQLTVLWKLELKNLLIKNDMPLFAQKDRGYIAGQIVEKVESELLGKQIAEELMRRDYSIYDAKDYTVYSNGENAFPAEEIVDILSEQNPQNFTLDQWIALYRQAATVREQKNALYQAPPKERTPHLIPYTEIEVSLGAPWIEADIISDFLAHLLGRGPAFSRGHVCYEPITGNWSISDKKHLGLGNTNAEFKYGLERYNALFILEATLNLREIKLFDHGSEYNEKDTLAALEKQNLIREEFKNWIWLDEDRRWQVEEAYNKMFRYECKSYDGSHLIFPDMSPEFSLFDYQKDAVQKILSSPNTLLAFDVGAGKTFIMIAAAMKMRDEGISRKNFFVVPNHIVGQWEKIFTDLYPKAKVLAIEPKSFKPEMRQKVLKQIRDADYDGIVMAYSCFEMIPLNRSIVLDNMNRELDRLTDALRDLRTKPGYHYKEMGFLDKEKKNIISLTEKFLASMSLPKSDEITFDDLEINTLFVDEAHNYKNIPIRTKLKNLNGINTRGSAKCLDLLHKVRHIQNTNGGRGVVFATGTPLCNSISDAYTMQMYLQYEEMEKTHLDVFDNWVKTFALPEQLCEIDVDTSKFRFIRKFSKFFNLPELSRMFSQIAIFHAVNGSDELPEMEGYTDVVIKKYPELTEYMQSLCKRTDAIRQKLVKPQVDNMLKVSTDGRKAALHLNLVGEEQPNGEHSKICQCVERVTELYTKYPHTTQLVFCDYSTPKTDGFNVYDEIRDRLMERGIPPKEIAFIHHYHTETRKLELFRKFNAGEIRILIGSTFKLGIGANVQVRLKAIHHLDVPWRPADMVQREGRIIRRGNENKSILIYRYITEGSFDSYCWQILETKQRFISQFLSGSSYQRSVSDLENNVLSYAEVKALALAEPLMKQLAEKENEIKTLKMVYSREKQAMEEVEKEYGEIDKKIDAARARWFVAYQAKKNLETQKRAGTNFVDLYQRLKGLLTDERLGDTKNTVISQNLMGFRLLLPEKQMEKKPIVLLSYCDKDYFYDGAMGHEESYAVEMGDTPNGNARRVINAIKNFDKILEKQIEIWNNIKMRKEGLEKTLRDYDHSMEKQIKECEEEVEMLRGLIAKRSE